MQKIVNKIIISVLLITMVVQTVSAAEKIPDLNAAVTKQNILNLLNAYDPNGFYIVQNANDGDGLLFWCMGGKITSNLGSAVHEECHLYSNLSNYKSDTIYIGNKKGINVKYTDVYKSEKMARTIPNELQTFRYTRYVAEPDSNLSSNVWGVYGLLNEFTAYCWGMNTGVSLYSYFKRFTATQDVWEDYITGGASNRLAYAEFKYYILKYLIYAKENYPDIYKEIIKNKSFLTAYNEIEKKYCELNKIYDKSLTDIAKLLTDNGYKAEYDGDRFEVCTSDNSGSKSYTYYYLHKDAYDKLIKEMDKPEYQKVIDILSK